MNKLAGSKALETLLLNSFRLRSLIDDLHERAKKLETVSKAA